MNTDRQYRSQFFTVRVWIEAGVHPPDEMRFRVQHIRSGEVRYFREWSALIEFLVAIAQADADSPASLHRPDFPT